MSLGTKESLSAESPAPIQNIWAIRVRLQLAEKTRDLALFNLAIERKLRACDLTKLRVRDIAHGEHVSSRAIVMQQNNLKIFCLGRTEGLTVVARLVETANLLLAGRKHIAGITNSFCARLKLLG